MAGDTVYKSIPDLDVLSGSLDGSETLPVVKSGKTYRRSWTNFFGSGWMANLLQAFSSFVAPNATHADDADTVGGETKATLHNAANLTGNIHLDRIPAELTGKNAATATLAANATLAGGVDFTNGNSGVYGQLLFQPNASVVIPKGTYMFTGSPSSYGDFYLSIYTGVGWARGQFPFGGGLVVSDGVNYRLQSTSNSDWAMSYRKLN